MERAYIPGVCNLSDAEARRRTIAGWLGLSITLVLEVYFVYAEIPAFLRLIIFIPASLGAMGFLQGLMHFCVNFGMRGVFNVSSEMGRTDSVSPTAYRAQDKVKAIRIILYSIAIGVCIAVLAYVS